MSEFSNLLNMKNLHGHVNDTNDNNMNDVQNFKHKVLCYNVLWCCDDAAMLRFFEMKSIYSFHAA